MEAPVSTLEVFDPWGRPSTVYEQPEQAAPGDSHGKGSGKGRPSGRGQGDRGKRSSETKSPKILHRSNSHRGVRRSNVRKIQPTQNSMPPQHTHRKTQVLAKPVPKPLPFDHPLMIEQAELKRVRAGRKRHWLSIGLRIGEEWNDPNSFDRQNFKKEEEMADAKFAALAVQIYCVENGLDMPRGQRGVHVRGASTIHEQQQPREERWGSNVWTKGPERGHKFNRNIGHRNEFVQTDQLATTEAGVKAWKDAQVNEWMQDMGMDFQIPQYPPPSRVTSNSSLRTRSDLEGVKSANDIQQRQLGKRKRVDSAILIDAEEQATDRPQARDPPDPTLSKDTISISSSHSISSSDESVDSLIAGPIQRKSISQRQQETAKNARHSRSIPRFRQHASDELYDLLLGSLDENRSSSNSVKSQDAAPSTATVSYIPKGTSLETPRFNITALKRAVQKRPPTRHISTNIEGKNTSQYTSRAEGAFLEGSQALRKSADAVTNPGMASLLRVAQKGQDMASRNHQDCRQGPTCQEHSGPKSIESGSHAATLRLQPTFCNTVMSSSQPEISRGINLQQASVKPALDQAALERTLQIGNPNVTSQELVQEPTSLQLNQLVDKPQNKQDCHTQMYKNRSFGTTVQDPFFKSLISMKQGQGLNSHTEATSSQEPYGAVQDRTFMHEQISLEHDQWVAKPRIDLEALAQIVKTRLRENPVQTLSEKSLSIGHQDGTIVQIGSVGARSTSPAGRSAFTGRSGQTVHLKAEEDDNFMNLDEHRLTEVVDLQEED